MHRDLEKNASQGQVELLRGVGRLLGSGLYRFQCWESGEGVLLGPALPQRPGEGRRQQGAEPDLGVHDSARKRGVEHHVEEHGAVPDDQLAIRAGAVSCGS
jgi:hypothetical protein